MPLRIHNLIVREIFNRAIRDCPKTSTAALTAPIKIKRRRGIWKALGLSVVETFANFKRWLQTLGLRFCLTWVLIPALLSTITGSIAFFLPIWKPGAIPFMTFVGTMIGLIIGLMLSDFFWKDWIDKVLKLSDEEIEVSKE